MVPGGGEESVYASIINVTPFEVTIMVSGRKQLEIDGETVTLTAGQAILVEAGSRVRYSNPFQVEAEYWSHCMPAFSVERVKREG